MKKLILLRGCPGSGKSTLAKELTGGSGSEYFEADSYFVNESGEYKFDATQIKLAHQKCKENVEFAMVYGPKPLNTIVVSNTFTQEWEMKDYYELAEKHGYTVFSLIVENRHNGKNEHNVPTEKLEKMKSRFEIKL